MIIPKSEDDEALRITGSEIAAEVMEKEKVIMVGDVKVNLKHKIGFWYCFGS